MIAVFVLDKVGVVSVAYLWLNLIGCILVVVLAGLFEMGGLRDDEERVLDL